MRRSALARVKNPAVGDALLVKIAVDGLIPWERGPNSTEAREVAVKLVGIAKAEPRLLREKWQELADRITHADHTANHRDVGDTSSSCHTDTGDHTDKGFRDLAFPPKPTDF